MTDGRRHAFELLRLAERSAHAGSWSWDIRSGAIFWSEGMFELLGVDATRGGPSFDVWRERVHLDDREAADRQIEIALSERKPLFNQYRVVLPDGSVRWIDAYGDTVFDRRGKPERMSGFCIDSTARIALEVDKAALERHLDETRRLEADLRKSRDALELALLASGQGFWEYDAVADRMTADERVHAMLGYRFGTVGASLDAWHRLLHPDDEKAFKADVAAHLRGRSEAFQNEPRLRHRSGRWIWVLCNGRVVERDTGGRAVRLVGTTQDISKFKRISDEGARLVGRFQALLAQAAAHSHEPASARDVQERGALDRLSRRQRQTLVLIAQGMSSAQIAQAMQISTATAVVHRRDVMRRLGLHNAADVARLAVRHGLVDG